MEMALNNGFSEMTEDEIISIDGGWTWWGIAVGAAAVATAYNELYDLGYKVGSWFR